MSSLYRPSSYVAHLERKGGYLQLGGSRLGPWFTCLYSDGLYACVMYGMDGHKILQFENINGVDKAFDRFVAEEKDFTDVKWIRKGYVPTVLKSDKGWDVSYRGYTTGDTPYGIDFYVTAGNETQKLQISFKTDELSDSDVDVKCHQDSYFRTWTVYLFQKLFEDLESKCTRAANSMDVVDVAQLANLMDPYELELYCMTVLQKPGMFMC